MVLGTALAAGAVLALAAQATKVSALQPLVGLIVILAIAYALSTNRRAIDTRTVAWGLALIKLSPALALVTNLDREHMEAYGSWQALKDAFLQFINKVPFYGAAVLCTDDEAVRELVPRAIRRVITYGLAGGVAPRCRRTRHAARAVRRRAAPSPSSVDGARSRARTSCGCRCRAATTCSTRWEPSRSDSSSRCRSAASPRRSRNSAAPNGASRCAASAAA